MKSFVSWSNCQGGGALFFLARTRLANEYSLRQLNNWQAILLEISHQSIYDALREADVLLYQPTTELQCVDGTIFPASDELIRRYCKPDCLKISFSYVFSHGFFPVLNVSPGPGGWITAALLKQRVWGPDSLSRHHDLMRDYNAGRLHFDCAKRFVECAAEQSKREQETDIKMVPWILQNYRKQRLFLTQNHLTSAVFAELARQILWKVYGPMGSWQTQRKDGLTWKTIDIPWTDQNEAQMNGVMPVHQAVVDELGLEYPATEGAHEYYRDLLEKMMVGK